jgi:hypothetical protein
MALPLTNYAKKKPPARFFVWGRRLLCGLISYIAGTIPWSRPALAGTAG